METIDIKEFRKANNLTQEQLATLIGVHLRTIQNWETGTKIPKSKYALLRNIMKQPIVESNATNSDVNINIGGNQKINNNSNEKLKHENKILMEKIAALQETIESLKRQLQEEKQRTEQVQKDKEEYWKMIQKLIK